MTGRLKCILICTSEQYGPKSKQLGLGELGITQPGWDDANMKRDQAEKMASDLEKIVTSMAEGEGSERAVGGFAECLGLGE